MKLKSFFNSLNGLYVALPSMKLITNFVPVLLLKRTITFDRSSKFEVFFSVNNSMASVMVFKTVYYHMKRKTLVYHRNDLRTE